MKNNIINRDECRQIMIDILKEIDRVCAENGITYTMGGGTLLGAVRHKGFIPWDDDIDIFIQRSQYDKLIELLKKSHVEWLSLLDSDTDGYYLPFAKAVNNKTMVKKQLSVLPHGIWVDIFPMDNLPDNKFKRYCFIKKCKFYRGLVISMITDFSNHKFGVKFCYKKILQLITCLIGAKMLLKWYVSYTKKYNKTSCESMSITWTPYGTEYIKKTEMLDIVKLRFENHEFNAISNYDVLLKRTFGDYMQLPPEGKRVNHSVTAWYV